MTSACTYLVVYKVSASTDALTDGLSLQVSTVGWLCAGRGAGADAALWII